MISIDAEKPLGKIQSPFLIKIFKSKKNKKKTKKTLNKLEREGNFLNLTENIYTKNLELSEKSYAFLLRPETGHGGTLSLCM